MIIMRLYGGLGNQMFQYALGRRLALLKKTSLWFDLTWFAETRPDGGTKREFQLDRFRIRGRRLPDRLCEHLLHKSPFQILNWLETPSRFDEQGPGFDARVFDCPRMAYIDGYWQTEKYFDAIESTIRNDFALVASLAPARRKILDRLKGRKSTSVHVRRGDYVENPAASALHGVCSAEWYAQAMMLMADGLENHCFVVFSDDIAWAKTNLPFYENTIFVDSEFDGRAYEDIHLMARCQNHIIANSSFSWWGAWLNPSKSKKVIAPKRWFLADTYMKAAMNDRIPPSWMQL
jgi:hypothetical protein